MGIKPQNLCPTKKHDGVKYCLPKFPRVGVAESLNFLCQELDQIPFLKAKNRSICTHLGNTTIHKREFTTAISEHPHSKIEAGLYIREALPREVKELA